MMNFINKKSFFYFLLFIFIIVGKNHLHAKEKINIEVFYSKNCIHCKKELKFLEKLQKKYESLEIKYIDIFQNIENKKLFENSIKKLNLKQVSIPFTLIEKKYYFIGFQDENTTGKDIEEIIVKIDRNSNIDTTKLKKNVPTTLKIPFLGEINIKDYSLPILTIILGLIDGFNPCAMWVLLILLSFLIATKNKTKLITLGTIFILSSAFVYFLFMVAWLKLIFFIGSIFYIKLLIGTLSISIGVYYLIQFFKNKENVCTISKSNKRNYITSKIQLFIEKKSFFLSAIFMIFLAFFINLIELFCSLGLPVIYTQILSLSNLSPFKYYMYILLYISLFILDNIVVFLIAIFTFRLINISKKYTHLSHLIGGVLLLILGMILIIKPELLMFSKV